MPTEKGRIMRKWLGMLAWGVAGGLAVAAAGKTYRDYPEWELLPKAIDFEDERVLASFQPLIDEGEAGHEAMLAIVEECEDSRLACIALGILRKSGGDKRAVVAELKRFFSERLPVVEGPHEWLMTGIAKFLADFGTEGDVEVLFPMLTHSNLRFRILGARYLAIRGGRAAVEALERAKGGVLYGNEMQEFDAAIAIIECRLAGGTSCIPMDVEEVWALLPKGGCLDDPREIANYSKLVEQGESIYGSLLSIIRLHTDGFVVSSALSVLRASDGDKREVVAELGKLVEARKSLAGPFEEAGLVSMAEAIADMGEAGDAELLVPLLEHPNGDVRNAARAGMEKLAGKGAE